MKKILIGLTVCTQMAISTIAIAAQPVDPGYSNVPNGKGQINALYSGEGKFNGKGNPFSVIHDAGGGNGSYAPGDSSDPGNSGNSNGESESQD